jgi:hypothetical protein
LAQETGPGCRRVDRGRLRGHGTDGLAAQQMLVLDQIGRADRDLFDANDHIEDRPTLLEKKIAALAPSPMGRMERIWLPDSEFSAGRDAAQVRLGSRRSANRV